MSDPSDPLLDLRDLFKRFPMGSLWSRRAVHAVDGVSLQINEGETLGLVGESGCGKSTLGRLATRLLPPTSGEVFFSGTDLVKLRGEKLRQVRRNLQMIFQDPYSSLNPRMSVGAVIEEPLRNFGRGNGEERRARVREVMALCGLNPQYASRYPHEFSGGQRQRVGIARALVLNPQLVVADEPVSALDVSIQAQIVNLLQELQQRLHLTYLFIAHDLSVVRHISDRVAVMYLGKIVEVADSDAVYRDPLHPYTVALLSSIPVPDPELQAMRRPIELKGEIPSSVNPPQGCRFHTRCPIAQEVCRELEPPLAAPDRNGHLVACHFPGDLKVAVP